MLNETQVKKLENNGFKRWTKKNYDRLYIDALKIASTNDGFQARVDRSRTFESKVQATKVYIDISTSETVIQYGMNNYSEKEEFKAIADAFISDIMGEQDGQK